MFEVNELTIEMTNKCNLNCPFCYCDSNTNSNELSIDQIKKAISIVKPKSISFTGGEPTLRQDDIIELLPYAHLFTGDNFKGIRIETNGTQKIDFNKFVLNGKPKGIHFNISLDGFKELHESQRGLNTWNKVIDFTKEALDRGYWTTAKATMPDDIILNNSEYLYEFAKFCAEIGLPRIRIGHVKDSGRGERNDGGEEYKKIIEKMATNIYNISNKIE